MYIIQNVTQVDDILDMYITVNHTLTHTPSNTKFANYLITLMKNNNNDYENNKK